MGNPLTLGDLAAQQNFNGPQGNQYDSGPAVVPAPQVPMAPNPAPGAAPNIQPEHPVDKLANAFIQNLISRMPPPPQQNPTQKGSFADKLSAAVNNVGASFGDAAAATQNLPQGVGGNGGVSRTLAARNERLTNKADKNFEHQQTLERAAREKRNDEILTAKNNLEMSVAQQRLENEKQEAQDRVYNSNKAAVSARETDGFDVERGVSENDLTQRMADFKGADGQHFGDVYEAIPTGGIDVNGQKVKTYDIVTRQSRPIKPTDEERNFIKANGGPDLPEGTEIPNAKLTALRLQAQRTALATHQIEEATQRSLDDSQKKVLSKDLQTGAVQHALSLHPEDRIAGIQEGLQQADAHVQHGKQLADAASKHGDPDAIAEAKQYLESAKQEQKSLQNVATFAFTKEDYENHRKAVEDRERDKDRKEREQDRRDAKGDKKALDGARTAFQDALSRNDFDPEAAREDLRKSNPKALSVLAENEMNSRQTTESTDELGQTKTVSKSKQPFFSIRAPQAQPGPQTAGQLVGPAADFQKAQDQQSTQESEKKQAEQDKFDQRPSEKGPTVFSGFGEAPNPNWNKAEEYLQKHPELDGPGRAAVRKQFTSQQKTSGANPPRPANVPANYVYNANGPKGAGWYKP